jgi:hypothetical protein
MKALKLALLAICLSACSAPLPHQSLTQNPVTVRVNVFRGASNIPIYMAIEKGFFARRGVTPILEFTPNSIQQRTGLADGKFDIAHAAVDNAVAMIETAKVDVVIVAGGDGGLNEFLVRSEINKLSDLKGRTFAVDVLDTLEKRISEQTYKDLQKSGSGLAKDSAFDKPRFRNVLELRAELEGQWAGVAPPPDRYLDLSFYNRALSQAHR